MTKVEFGIRIAKTSPIKTLWEIQPKKQERGNSFYSTKNPFNQIFDLRLVSPFSDLLTTMRWLPEDGKGTNAIISIFGEVRHTHDLGTIQNLFMHSSTNGLDQIGIRLNTANFSYTTNGATFIWHGTGIVDKPIGDFHVGAYENAEGEAYFLRNVSSSIEMRVHRRFLPEPEEYALAFGLFALGFVFFHCRFFSPRSSCVKP